MCSVCLLSRLVFTLWFILFNYWCTRCQFLFYQCRTYRLNLNESRSTHSLLSCTLNFRSVSLLACYAIRNNCLAIFADQGLTLSTRCIIVFLLQHRLKTCTTILTVTHSTSTPLKHIQFLIIRMVVRLESQLRLLRLLFCWFCFNWNLP